MIVNVVLFAVLLYGANSLFVQKYYTYSKKTVLIESSQKISEIIMHKRVRYIPKEIPDRNL